MANPCALVLLLGLLALHTCSALYTRPQNVLTLEVPSAGHAHRFLQIPAIVGKSLQTFYAGVDKGCSAVDHCADCVGNETKRLVDLVTDGLSSFCNEESTPETPLCEALAKDVKLFNHSSFYAVMLVLSNLQISPLSIALTSSLASHSVCQPASKAAAAAAAADVDGASSVLPADTVKRVMMLLQPEWLGLNMHHSHHAIHRMLHHFGHHGHHHEYLAGNMRDEGRMLDGSSPAPGPIPAPCKDCLRKGFQLFEDTVKAKLDLYCSLEDPTAKKACDFINSHMYIFITAVVYSSKPWTKVLPFCAAVRQCVPPPGSHFGLSHLGEEAHSGGKRDHHHHCGWGMLKMVGRLLGFGHKHSHHWEREEDFEGHAQEEMKHWGHHHHKHMHFGRRHGEEEVVSGDGLWKDGPNPFDRESFGRHFWNNHHHGHIHAHGGVMGFFSHLFGFGHHGGKEMQGPYVHTMQKDVVHGDGKMVPWETVDAASEVEEGVKKVAIITGQSIVLGD